MAWERYRVGRLGEERYGVGASGGLLGAAVRAAASQPCGCELASPFFANPIQNEFFGIAFFTPEPAGAWAPLRPGRWVYEKKGKQQPCGEAARESWAPLHGGLRRPLSVPVHHSPHSRGALRYAGVPTIAGEHHPSTATAARP